jgi:hypothetical protein
MAGVGPIALPRLNPGATLDNPVEVLTSTPANPPEPASPVSPLELASPITAVASADSWIGPVAQSAPAGNESPSETKKVRMEETIRPLSERLSTPNSTDSSLRTGNNQANKTTSGTRVQSAHPTRLRYLDDRWIWEFLSCVVAFACIIAIAGVLATHSGKPLPAWPKLISINTMVAVFTAVMKACLMVPVAQGMPLHEQKSITEILLVNIMQGLSQLKWLWFREPRQLVDMDDFDNASRGPLGSFKLILKARKQ